MRKAAPSAGVRSRTVRLLVAALLAWILVQGLREGWRAYQYHLADPWPPEAPVLWTVDAGHVEALARRLDRLGLGDEPPGTVVAVSPDPALGEQGWYQYLWVAYLLPDLHVRRAVHPQEGLASDLWLVMDGAVPEADGRFEPLASADGATLYRVGRR